MNSPQYFQFKQSKQSCFSWWLVLSLGPIIGLICFGFWVVGQEQKYAQQDVQENLQVASSRVMKRLEYHLRDTEFNTDKNLNTRSFPITNPGTFVLPLDATGNCLLPKWPVKHVLPTPYRMPWEFLTETEILQWNEAHMESFDQKALDAANVFLNDCFVEPFATLMQYRKLLLLEKLHNYQAALDGLDRFRIEINRKITTESGMPVQVALEFLELRLVKALTPKKTSNPKDELFVLSRFIPKTQRLYQNPNPWSSQILDVFQETEKEMGVRHYSQYFYTLVERAKRAENIYLTIPKSRWSEWVLKESFLPAWVKVDDQSLLFMRSQSNEGQVEFRIHGKELLKKEFGKWLFEGCMATDQPSLYHFQIHYGGEWITDHSPAIDSIEAKTKDQAISTSSVNIVTHSDLNPQLRLTGTLLNPKSFFIRSQKRIQSMVWLMSLAGFTGLVGLFAQRRAFRRQVELGRMKSNFVASVSHELRAPIASIRLMAENLSQQKESGEAERKDYFEWIGLECRRLSSLVQNILQFSRLELGKREYSFESVDVQSLFDETLKLMEPLATNAQVNLKSGIKDGDSSTGMVVPEAVWDGQAIHQALVNLIDNAIKHTSKDGSVVAELMVIDKRDIIEFRVTDQGPGIDPVDRERIFRPFERLGSEMTRKTKGVGIGLNLVWHTAKAHEGTVRVESAAKGGSCFVLSLPIHPRQS